MENKGVSVILSERAYDIIHYSLKYRTYMLKQEIKQYGIGYNGYNEKLLKETEYLLKMWSDKNENSIEI